MPRRPFPTRDLDDAASSQEVESEIEELGDPEGGPALPATTLAAHTALPRPTRPTAPGLPSGRSLSYEIFRLGWPVMLSQALVSIAGLVDRMMIGRLGGEAGSAVPLAAVGYATQFFFLIQSALFAVGLACVALMARAIGAGEIGRAREALAGSLQVALGVTIVFTAIMLAGADWMLAGLGARPEVVEAAVPYLQLIVGSTSLLAVTLTLDSALRADRNMRTPMLISMGITIVKLVFNWLLIYGELGFPRLGLTGAGWATVISQAVGLVAFVTIAARAPATSAISLRLATILRPSRVGRQVLRIALPGIAERVVLNLGLLSYFWVLSRYYGTVAVAAYTVGVPLLSFSWIPGTGYAQSCATLVGQQLGARDPDAAMSTGKRAAGLALMTAVPLGILFAVFREPLAWAFTNDAAVVAALGPFMLALAIGQPFLQLHFTLGGAHRGAGDTWTPLIAATIGNWIFRVPLACLFAIVLQTDVTWVWYALIFDHMTRAAWLAHSFRRGDWRRQLGVGF